MDGYIVGNFAANALLIGIVGWFIKRWMSLTEQSVRKTAFDLAVATAEHRKEIADINKQNRDEVRMAENELLDIAKENKQGIKDLVNQVRIANGRTGHLETELVRVEGIILTQSALCKQRNAGRRITDRCGDL